MFGFFKRRKEQKREEKIQRFISENEDSLDYPDVPNVPDENEPIDISFLPPESRAIFKERRKELESQKEDQP